MKSHILLNITTEELEKLLRKIICEELEKLPKQELLPKVFPELLTKGQAAKLLGISLPSLSLYIKNGQIKACKLGSRYRFNKDDLINSIQLLKSHRHNNA